MPRRLLPLAFALLACTRSSSALVPECPPCGETPPPAAEADTEITEPEPTAPAPREVEALTVTADDGHALRLWTLALPEATAKRGAILLLHGRTWSALPDFDLRVGPTRDPALSLMHLLAAEGYVTYALDLRGYGQTERDATGWLEPDRAADDLAAALRFVAEREQAAPDLLGWSFGALVAQLAIQRDPTLARSLVLYGYPRDPDARTPKRSETGDPPRKQNSDAAARSDFITPGTISDAAIQAYVDAALSADPVRVDWRALHQFDALDSADLEVPTLVVHGVRDPIAEPLWQAKLFTRLRVPDKQWVVIPEADHAAHLEQPQRFVVALLAFLRRSEPA